MWKEFKEYIKKNHFSVFGFFAMIACSLYIVIFVIVGIIKKLME